MRLTPVETEDYMATLGTEKIRVGNYMSLVVGMIPDHKKVTKKTLIEGIGYTVGAEFFCTISDYNGRDFVVNYPMSRPEKNSDGTFRMGNDRTSFSLVENRFSDDKRDISVRELKIQLGEYAQSLQSAGRKLIEDSKTIIDTYGDYEIAKEDYIKKFNALHFEAIQALGLNDKRIY